MSRHTLFCWKETFKTSWSPLLAVMDTVPCFQVCFHDYTCTLSSQFALERPSVPTSLSSSTFSTSPSMCVTILVTSLRWQRSKFWYSGALIHPDLFPPLQITGRPDRPRRRQVRARGCRLPPSCRKRRLDHSIRAGGWHSRPPCETYVSSLSSISLSFWPIFATGLRVHR